ncbi:MAG: MarR family transcriptional regulator [Candidatus Omnitrophota bacterium]
MSNISLAEFADRMTEIMSIISREFMRQQSSTFYKVKVTMPQFVILNFLKREGELTMTEIARFLNVTTAAVTGIIDRLVRERYAVRMSDPKDRRIVRIKMTPKGTRVVDSIHQHQHRMLIDIFGRITQEEREQYLKILMHIREHLK